MQHTHRGSDGNDYRRQGHGYDLLAEAVVEEGGRKVRTYEDGHPCVEPLVSHQAQGVLFGGA